MVSGELTRPEGPASGLVETSFPLQHEGQEVREVEKYRVLFDALTKQPFALLPAAREPQ